MRSKFKECKWSVTSQYYSGGSSINIYLKESPYENKKNPYTEYHDRKEWKQENNLEVEAIINYASTLMESFNYDNSDSQSDYFCVNFYGHCSVDYDYKQTEQTEEHKKDIEDFRKKLQEQKEREEEQKHLEYLKYKEEQEQREVEYKKRKEENDKAIEKMQYTVETLDDEKQYILKDIKYPSLNKQSTFGEYYLQKEFNINDTIIQKELHFNDIESLNTFKNNLLTDFEFLAGSGRSRTNDKRINSMDDFYKMTKEEKETVKWYTLGIAIYLNDKIQFVVDTQGYNYSRYIGLYDNNKKVDITEFKKQELTEEEQKQKDLLEDISLKTIADFNLIDTWHNTDFKTYKQEILKLFKRYHFTLTKEVIQSLDEGHLKNTMYKIYLECDGLQEQFKNVKLEHEEDITIFSLGMGISETQCKYIRHENSKYAQYTDVVDLVYKVPKKKQLRQRTIHKEVLIVKGNVELPQDFGFIVELTETNDNNEIIFKSKVSKYASFDKQYWKDLIDYVKLNNLEVLVNTVQPIF